MINLISQEILDDLEEKAHLLECLLHHGVKNWEGYEAAHQMYDEEVD